MKERENLHSIRLGIEKEIIRLREEIKKTEPAMRTRLLVERDYASAKVAKDSALDQLERGEIGGDEFRTAIDHYKTIHEKHEQAQAASDEAERVHKIMTRRLRDKETELLSVTQRLWKAIADELSAELSADPVVKGRIEKIFVCLAQAGSIPACGPLDLNFVFRTIWGPHSWNMAPSPGRQQTVVAELEKEYITGSVNANSTLLDKAFGKA